MELLHSQIIGEGKPFLIIHGFLGMGDNWRTLGRQFSEEGYEVHLLDMRNHGRSFHSNTFDYTVMMEDVKTYIEVKKLNPVVLLGHSMGGKVAMRLAVEYPDCISKLIVADIGPKQYPQHHQAILKGLSSLVFANSETGKEGIESRNEADKALSKYVGSAAIRQFLLKNLYWKSKGHLALRMNLPVLVKQIEEIGRALDVDAVYDKEALFIYGGESDYILPEDHVGIKHHFPNSIFKEVQDAGHWLHAENPKDFFKYIMDFL